MSSFEQSRREQRASARRAMYGRNPMLSEGEREDIARRMPAYEATAQAVEQGIGDQIADPTNIALMAAGPVVNAMLRAPRVAAPVLAALGLTAGSGEVNSQSALTKAQQRQLEMDAERRRIQAEADRRAEQNKLDADTARKEVEMRIAEAERVAQEKINAEERNKTFLQKYPGVADALPGIGLMVGATVPAVGKVLSQRARNLPMREWRQTVNEAEDALGRTDWLGRSNPDVGRAGDKIAQLDKFNAQYKTGGLPSKDTTWVGMGGKDEPMFHVPSMMFGGAVAAEASMFPDQWNAMNLPPDNPERAESRARALNPLYYLERGAMGALTGASGYKAGAMMYPDIPGPAARSRGLVQKYGTTPESVGEALRIDARTQDALKTGVRSRQSSAAADPRNVPPGQDGVVIVPGELPAGQQQLPASSPRRGGQGWPIVGSKSEQKAIEDEYLARIHGNGSGGNAAVAVPGVAVAAGGQAEPDPFETQLSMLQRMLSAYGILPR